MKTNSAGGRGFSTRSARAATAVGAALFLASLAACTGGSTPIVTETPSLTTTASAAPSPSPSPTALTDAELLALMPPEAAYPDVRGAIATAEFFLEQYAPVLETGDLTVWDALSMPDCVFCESVRDHVRSNAASGNFETGGALTLDPNTVVANYYTADGFTYVTLDYGEGPSILHRADGSTEQLDQGESGSISLQMTLPSTVWRVNDVGVEPH